MTVLITGATSFLGRAVIAELQNRGHEVLAFRHGIETEKLPEDLSGKRPVLIHFGWAGAGSAGRQDEAVQASNIEQSMETLKLAEKLGCRRFLFSGSQAEYSCTSAYGRAKKAFGEKAVRFLEEERLRGAGRMEFLHLRIFSVYGPGDHENALISSLIRAAKDGRDMELGPCTQRWNYLYVTDLAEIVADLAERQETAGGVIDIGSDDIRPLCEFVREAWEICSRECGKNTGKLLFGSRQNNAEGAADLIPDCKRLKEIRTKAAVPFSEGIKKTVYTYL